MNKWKCLSIISAIILLCDVCCSSIEFLNGTNNINSNYESLMRRVRCKADIINGRIVKQGIFTEWYESGGLKSTGLYKDDYKEGLWTTYYDVSDHNMEKGQQESEYSFLKGVKNGHFVCWYSNGKKQSEGTYKDGRLVGLCIEWDENGQKSKEFTYNDNENITKSLADIEAESSLQTIASNQWEVIKDHPIGLKSISFGSNRFVAVGERGTIAISNNGAIWQQIHSGISNNLQSITYGDGVFVAVGSGSTIIMSKDASTWVSTKPPLSDNLLSVIYVNHQFVVECENSNKVLKSSDGLQWSSNGVDQWSSTVRSVAFGKKTLVAVGITPTIQIYDTYSK